MMAPTLEWRTQQQRWRPLFAFASAILWILWIVRKEDRSVSFDMLSSSQREESSSLTSPQRMQQIGTNLARSFPRFALDSWCTKEGYTRFSKKKHNSKTSHYFESPKGFLLVKVPKSASSTMAGVVDRIAHNHGDCDHQSHHVTKGSDFYYGNRDRNTSFLLGSIRDPASRAISRVFFHQVSRYGEDPTDENVLNWLNTTDRAHGTVSSGQGGFQLNYMTLDPIEPWSAYDWNNNVTVRNPEQVEQNVQRVIEQYDFMVVVERMDESLVVLQLLIGVNVGDILTLDTKVKGSYYYDDSRCFKIVKSHVSPRVKEYISSDVWKAQNYGDYLLHAAASESLDRTIEALGRDQVERGLVEYRRLKAMVNKKCASKDIFACSAKGVEQPDKTTCYLSDHNCGYPCIDETLIGRGPEIN